MTTDAQNLRLAALAINGDLARALRKYIDGHDDQIDEPEGAWPGPDMGCPICTIGMVPDSRNGVLCLFHMATEVLGEYGTREKTT